MIVAPSPANDDHDRGSMNPARRTTTAAAAAVVLATAGGLLTATAAPASAATTCTSPVFKRQFFANTTFSGTPKKTDCDSVIDQNWGTGAPASGLPTNYFGVRWSVTRDFGSGGPFTLSASGLDGIRVYLDGTRKIDLWKNTSTTVSKTVNLTIPTGKHTLRIDYANWTGSAKVKFTYTPRTSATVDKVKPLAPTGASVSYDTATGKATIRWAKNKEMDLAGYRVYRRLKGTSFGSTPLATTTSTSYTDTTLPATGDTYYYEIRAHDKAGNISTGTADLAVVTPDRTGPAAPTGLTAHGDLHGMVLGWNPVADAAGYELYEKDSATGGYTLVAKVTGTSYVHRVGDRETSRTYVVRAYDPAGNAGGYSAAVTSDGVDRTAPAAPQNLVVKAESGVTRLWWSAPQNPTQDELANGARFSVLRSEGTALGADPVRVTCAEEDRWINTSLETYSLYCTDESFELDTTYTYGVTLIDGAGNESAVSSTVTVTTEDPYPPLPLTGLTATPRADGTVLRWDPPADDDIAAYRAFRGVRQSDGSVKWLGELAHCADNGDDPLAMLCIDIPDGETYVYTVIATDVWGNTLSLLAPSVPTVTATELDIVPGEPIGKDTGPVTAGGGWTVSEQLNPARWSCNGDVCDTITEYRVSRWNAATRAYEPVGTAAAVAGTKEYSFTDQTQPLGSVSYYRVVGVLADGTETAAAHPWVIRPDLV
ncbi:putative Fibronectin type III domain protein (Precursor) [Streptomyces viridochromogenes Tue57]|uniref:Putative Fibronectin type III domain protein (Precursor) n=2 Tax=Streptomyces viridochromogenes TaxID=1938 RepID=L8PFY1_STRVR|nr:putative Fibronectin type III domain protein (Precursor) [Streptomyces viridochromogenes Tue57]